MLSWLQVKQFAIVERIELELQAGLSVITGETGAGKSIIINALAMVLGQRADAAMVKHGHARAEISASFDIHAQPSILKLLASLDLDDEQECQLRRVINADSGSKAYVNGRMVTASTLRTIGQQLVDIHGQHEHQSLLRPETQRELLDRYAGISAQVGELGQCHQALSEHIHKLAQLRTTADSAKEKLEFLNFQYEELDRFAPKENEWKSLHKNHQRMHHQADIATSIQTAELALFGDSNDSASKQLGIAVQALEKANAFAPELKELASMLSEAQTLIQESETGLRAVSESAVLDEAALEALESRYAETMELARKHRVEPQALYATYQSLSAQLELAQHPEANEKKLAAQIDKQSARYRKLAGVVSLQRKKYADKLSSDITRAMQTLAMEGGEFYIELTKTEQPFKPLQDIELGGIGSQTGLERVAFEVSTNLGMPKMPLAKVASGGELSRISLALQLILSDLATVNTLIFDEVDVGVGGKTAAIIGKMLAQLAKNRQILCITHLPQVAAHGTQHFRVNKQTAQAQNSVHFSLAALSSEEKIAEIGRMVGGESLTDESLAHARTLIENSS